MNKPICTCRAENGNTKKCVIHFPKIDKIETLDRLRNTFESIPKT